MEQYAQAIADFGAAIGVDPERMEASTTADALTAALERRGRRLWTSNVERSTNPALIESLELLAELTTET